MTSTNPEREQTMAASPISTPAPPGMHLGTHKEIAKLIDPTAEEAYWRENYESRPYVTGGTAFNEYRTAYRYGIDAYAMHEGRSFEQAEPELVSGWDLAKGLSSLTWDDARHATRDAWQHVSDSVEHA
ncbi:MAG: hypothetical protein IPJ97_10455 [Proteobacteria bacterium]|nr:hypothetical protein [Pseudomonadota bacterium]